MVQAQAFDVGIKNVFKTCCRRTHAALEMWKEMGDKASTPSTVAPSGKAAKTGAQATPGVTLTEAGDVAAAAAPAEVFAKLPGRGFDDQPCGAH